MHIICHLLKKRIGLHSLSYMVQDINSEIFGNGD